MKFVMLFGAPAVGKMTVGQELAKITNLRLFHGHMSIEPVVGIFGRRDVKTEARLREVVFEEFAKSDLHGMIFTYFCALDNKDAWLYVEKLIDIFQDNGAEIYFVELVASQEVRLKRNGTANRLLHKPSKQDIEKSNARLIELDEKIRIISFDGEIPYKNYTKIDNSNLEPIDVAGMIKKEFLL